MALLSMQEVSIAFGGPPVLDRATFAIERGERVCLLGRNGAGKSTLMKLLDGTLTPGGGEVVRQSGVSVARLEQEVPQDLEGTTYEVVAAGLGETGRLLARYHQASLQVESAGSEEALRDLDRLHHALDTAGAWQVKTRVETALLHLGLDAEAPVAEASGGRKRQILLARALVMMPDLLLLDEPTNHLDLEAVEWLEGFLIERKVTLLFVTHDRAFLRRVATRIAELDRGRLVDWGGAYDTYLERKEAALAVEEREWAEFDKKLAREEAWIRTGIKARRTRNEGRVRALEVLRRERGARRERTGAAKLQAQESDRSGRLVIEARGVSFSRGNRAIIHSFDTLIMRGDRVGLIGPNGSGKTTLLRLLLGELPPDSGSVRLGVGLEVAYFDQLRAQLDPERTVFDSVADGHDFVEIQGKQKHVLGYLQDFLFSADRARTPVHVLSGGERNRLLLARLFTRSFNLLVLDEPTNDLDLETLELLEELLTAFSGTLLLVSHDRAFLDNLVTSTLVLEGGGRVGEYVGGYSDWMRQKPAPAAPPPPAKSEAAAPTASRNSRRRRLSFKEAAELAALPEQIDTLEQERAQLYASLADPALLRQGAAVAVARVRLAALETEIAEKTARWELLATIEAEG
ncbi:MAG: ATP-binding cassette domain-containing protein [Candidatus Latescibacteria bacterium]|nr:ATP-binding cassette domain-containing protein [Candidatus Latescibacterota bacterium]